MHACATAYVQAYKKNPGTWPITANYYKWRRKSYVEPKVAVAAYEGVTAHSYLWYWGLSNDILGVLTMGIVSGRHYGEGSSINLPGMWFLFTPKWLFLSECKLKTQSQWSDYGTHCSDMINTRIDTKCYRFHRQLYWFWLKNGFETVRILERIDCLWEIKCRRCPDSSFDYCRVYDKKWDQATWFRNIHFT